MKTFLGLFELKMGFGVQITGGTTDHIFAKPPKVKPT